MSSITPQHRRQLSDEQKREFKELGFIVLPNAIDADLVERARSQLRGVVPESRDEYDAVVDGERSLSSPDRIEPFERIDELLFAYAEELIGEDVLDEPEGQPPISLNYPLEDSPHEPNAPQIRDLDGHIDGYPEDYEMGDDYNYSQLYSLVYLDRVRPMGGGFTVWPGSHWNVGEYFEDHSLESGRGGIPGFDEDGNWDYDTKRYAQFDGYEASGDAGTVVLAHFKMQHSDGVNLSQTPRIAQLRLFGRNDVDPEDAAANIWKYWPGMADVAVSPGFGDTRVTDPRDDAVTVDVIEKRGTHDHHHPH